MSSSKWTHVTKFVTLLLALMLIVPYPVNAAESDIVQPYASNYLDSYNTYIYVTSSGEVQVWFTVVADNVMDEVGALSVILYESTDNSNWTRVKTYSHENYSSMLRYDNYVHSSYVSYNGSTTKYYKAYVCLWAGKNGSGDTRYMWAYE